MSQLGVEKIASLPVEQRIEIFQEASADIQLVPAAVEKDFWVCWALKRIFSDEFLAENVLFKGGTSLSKCYGLIQRFSEDIDLILNWELLTDEDPYKERSNTQQDRFNKNMERQTIGYLETSLLPHISKVFDGFDVGFKPDSPKSLILKYPKAFDADYIKPDIELEFGAMSAMVPNKTYRIKPYCSDLVADTIGSTDVEVQAIQAIKTFWDKVTILHCEAHRPEDKPQPSRYSRHYYDLYQMLNSNTKSEALDNKALLNDIFEFKLKFYPQRFANYQRGLEGQVRLIPPEFRLESLKRDYQAMEEMIFGAYPSWETILETLAGFEQELSE